MNYAMSDEGVNMLTLASWMSLFMTLIHELQRERNVMDSHVWHFSLITMQGTRHNMMEVRSRFTCQELYSAFFLLFLKFNFFSFIRIFILITLGVRKGEMKGSELSSIVPRTVIFNFRGSFTSSSAGKNSSAWIIGDDGFSFIHYYFHLIQ